MPTRRPLSVDLVLVPVDASDESVDAIACAAAIAAEYDASVHAVHVLAEDDVRAIENGDVDKAQVAADGEAIMESAEGIAADHDVELSTSVAYGFSTKMKLRHPGSVVLDTAEEIDADGRPRRGTREGCRVRTAVRESAGAVGVAGAISCRCYDGRNMCYSRFLILLFPFLLIRADCAVCP
jgi:nucleotide-binding universal stress UspA family protein